MIESLVSVRLPADEELTIKKNRLTGVGCEDGKRIAVVTGIHGDELEGQYVCYELVRLITANMAHLKGTVDNLSVNKSAGYGVGQQSRADVRAGHEPGLSGKHLRSCGGEYRGKAGRRYKGRGRLR